jgi:hypothetical protein
LSHQTARAETTVASQSPQSLLVVHFFELKCDY